MATTTPNFGWSVPTSTDLVKDGATAIETLGDSIDASLVDLKGGTTGQVLAKASATDMDFQWVAADDTNAIQNALLTTTGDTIYASGASTPARLGIGSTGQVLTVAGGVPTWAAAPSGSLDLAQIATGTLSGSGFSLTGLSSYDTLELRVSGANINTGVGAQDLRFYCNADNSGSNWEYCNLEIFNRTTFNKADLNTFFTTGEGWFRGNNSAPLKPADTANQFRFRLTNCKATGMTMLYYNAAYNLVAGAETCEVYATGSGYWKTEAAIASVQFNSQFQTFGGGTYTLWGA